MPIRSRERRRGTVARFAERIALVAGEPQIERKTTSVRLRARR